MTSIVFGAPGRGAYVFLLGALSGRHLTRRVRCAQSAGLRAVRALTARTHLTIPNLWLTHSPLNSHFQGHWMTVTRGAIRALSLSLGRQSRGLAVNQRWVPPSTDPTSLSALRLSEAPAFSLPAWERESRALHL